MIPVTSTLAALFVGRTALSVLPPGRTGEHALGALPLTCAVSFGLGLAILAAQLFAFVTCGLAVNAWTLLVPWVFVAAARLALAPGAMVPRHAPRRERAGLLALASTGAAAVAVPLAVWSAALAAGEFRVTGVVLDFSELSLFEDLTSALTSCAESAHAELAFLRIASSAAFVQVCAHGLALPELRLGANVRAGLLVLVAAGLVAARTRLAFADDLVHEFLALALGVAFGVEWLVRAERRALALAVCGFAIAPLFAHVRHGPLLAGFAGLVLVVGLTAAPARGRAARWCGAGLAAALCFVVANYAKAWMFGSG